MSGSLADLDDAGLLRFAEVFSGQLASQIENIRYRVERGLADPGDLAAVLRARDLWALKQAGA